MGKQAKKRLLEGAKAVNDLVAATMGPGGRNVVIEREYTHPVVTRDGVTVANEVRFQDRFMDMGAAMIRQASSKSNDSVGDGTSSTTVLAYAMSERGVRDLSAGDNAIRYRRGMEDAVEAVAGKVMERVTEVGDIETLTQVSVVSANDRLIGEQVAKAMWEAGKDGSVTVDDGYREETEIESIPGMRVDRPLLSPYLINDKASMTCIANDAAVYLVREKIDRPEQYANFLSVAFAKQGGLDRRSVVIVADDFSEQVIGAFISIAQSAQGLTILPIKTPDFGEGSDEVMADIAAYTGATCIGGKSGKASHEYSQNEAAKVLGYSPKVSGERLMTVFSGGGAEKLGKQGSLDERIAGLRAEIEREDSKYRKEKLKIRLGRLSGRVINIRVGGRTETDMKERRMRFEDAVSACRAAMESGVVLGGGTALVYAREQCPCRERHDASYARGWQNVLDACSAPMMTIAENAGYDREKIVRTYVKNCFGEVDYGFNAAKGVFSDLDDDGIFDPADVTVNALRNACAGAVMLLTTEAAMKILRLDKTEFIPE